MTSYDTMNNHLHLAGECSESIKRNETELLIKIKFSFALYCVRAICHALVNIADAIREKK